MGNQTSATASRRKAPGPAGVLLLSGLLGNARRPGLPTEGGQDPQWAWSLAARGRDSEPVWKDGAFSYKGTVEEAEVLGVSGDRARERIASIWSRGVAGHPDFLQLYENLRSVAPNDRTDVAGRKSTEPRVLHSVRSAVAEEIAKHAKHTPTAMFVIPSQLNACEYPDYRDADVVTQVKDYVRDRTGGPAAQLACHPAVAQAILNTGESTRNPLGFQSLKRVALPGGWHVKNGYLGFGANIAHDDVVHFAQNLPAAATVKFSDAPVTGVLPGPGGALYWGDTPPENYASAKRVYLAYASAAPVGAYLNRTADDQKRRLQGHASVLLIAQQYLTSLQEAARLYRGTPLKVFLMPLGGGVFENDKADVARAASWAVRCLNEEDYKKLEVRFLTYNASDADAAFEAWFPEAKTSLP